MGALLLVAAALRLPALNSAPPGLQFDETYNAWDALRVVEGARPVFLPANAGREPLYTYWQALFVALWGPTSIALRLASALPGIATVLLLYGFVRLLFPREGRELAGLAALCLALSYWHLHFSRYGIRSILIPFWEIPTFAALWLGLRTGDRRCFPACGLGLAAMVWTHPLGRFMPVVVMVSVLHMTWADRQFARRHLLELLVVGMVALCLSLPLGYYFWKHPAQFLGHTSEVSVFHPRVHRGDVVRSLSLNVLRVLGMFTFLGDREWLHNLPGRPALDPLLSVAFVVGLVAAGRRLLRHGVGPLQRGPWVLLSAWLVVLLIPSALSDMAPNFSRTIGVVPVAALLAAWGLRRGRRWLEEVGRPHLARGLVVAVIVISGSWTAWDYFVRFTRHPMAYYHYDQDKIDCAAFLRRESAENTLYLAPLWAHHPTISLLTRDIDLRSVETNAVLVFPSREGRKGVLYAFPPEQEHNVMSLAQDWRDWGQRDVIRDPQGEVLLHLFRIPASRRPFMGEGAALVADAGFPLGMLEGTPVQFGPSLRLLGYQVTSDLNAEREVEIILVWEVLGSMAVDYTCFVHLMDAHGQRWGQADSWPGQGSYPTSNWRPGDVIVDHYGVQVHPCFPPGRHRLDVGWYSLATGERLRTLRGGLMAHLGTVELASAPGVDKAELSPTSQLDYRPSEGMHLFGFDLPEVVLEVGRPFPLTLYWEAALHVREPVTVLLQLRDSKDMIPIHAVALPALGSGRGRDPTCSPGRAHCQTLRPSLESVPEGSYQLSLQAVGKSEQAVDMTEVQVMQSSRRYSAPPMGLLLQQDFGDAIRLLGCNLSDAAAAPGGSVALAAGDVLRLTLYWQMRRPVQTGYTVFTHLLHEGGELWGQQDSVPAKGTYPTTEWVEGEVVEDPFRIAVANDAPPGRYQLEVGLYDAATGQRLPLTVDGHETGEDRVLLPVKVIVQ
jgi:4-amino-4-deoxy-L-arabinose transferase-like glycosyltransferase